MKIVHILVAALTFTGVLQQNPATTLGNTQNTSAEHILSSQTYSLDNRYKVPSVNSVFADNILLTLSYMAGQTKEGQKVNWDKVRQPAQFTFELKPGKTFAFHDLVMDQYKNSVVQTTHAHFSADEGFRSDGWLVGDGVCHFASFINVVSSQAGLEVIAPTKHDFAKIPDVSREFGTAIYYDGQASSSSRQNLYVTNTTTKTIAFVFNHTQNTLQIAIEQLD